jgi:hypothetical protein
MSEGLCACGCGGKTAIAKVTDARFGWVKDQPLKYLNGHNRRKGALDYIEEDRGYKTPCWIWQRSVNNRGYGYTSRNGEYLAHRAYYVEKFGRIPEGLEVDHLCRVRLCVNPMHLEPVTPAVNRQRGQSAKIDEAMVRLIRASPLKSRTLGKELGISHTTINDVRSGRRWGNVR